MGNFNKFNKGRSDRGGFGGGGGNFDGGRKFSDRSDGPRQMHQAVCNECGQNCEVPFKPTGDRPVFCSNCFKSQNKDNLRFASKSFGGGGRSSNFSGNSGGNAGVNTSGAVAKAQLEALNAKLDKILSILLAPNKVAAVVKDEVKEKKKAKAPVKKSKSQKK